MIQSCLPLLVVEDLAVSFDVRGGRINAVDGVSFSIRPGETLGIVGESGSGKSVMAYSLVGLLAGNGRIDRGQIRFNGQDLLAEPGMPCVQVRGRQIAFIFQNPRAALNPIRSVGDQVRDALEASGRAPRRQSAQRALELLDQVRIERAKDRFGAYPHELSGGMCQRILIAMALAAEPKLLIADEPTTGLDVTTQKIIMDTLYELGASNGLATLLITHDVGLAARYCRRIAVMCEGKDRGNRPGRAGAGATGRSLYAAARRRDTSRRANIVRIAAAVRTRRLRAGSAEAARQ